jgi:hypothetical protein
MFLYDFFRINGLHLFTCSYGKYDQDENLTLKTIN